MKKKRKKRRRQEGTGKGRAVWPEEDTHAAGVDWCALATSVGCLGPGGQNFLGFAVAPCSSLPRHCFPQPLALEEHPPECPSVTGLPCPTASLAFFRTRPWGRKDKEVTLLGSRAF